MVMKQISVLEAKRVAMEKGLKPAKIRGTEIVQFTKKGGERFEVLDWDEFESTLAQRGLAVYESGGWMKIMQK